MIRHNENAEVLEFLSAGFKDRSRDFRVNAFNCGDFIIYLMPVAAFIRSLHMDVYEISAVSEKIESRFDFSFVICDKCARSSFDVQNFETCAFTETF